LNTVRDAPVTATITAAPVTTGQGIAATSASQVVRVEKMESKAPLGRVTVGLKSLSQLYVAAVHVESQDPNYPAAWNAVRSRKLRRKALLSFLEPAFENPTSHVPRLDERPPKRPFALNMRVAKEVDGKEVDGKEVDGKEVDGKEVDHIIIPFGSVSDEQGIIKVLGDLPDQNPKAGCWWQRRRYSLPGRHKSDHHSLLEEPRCSHSNTCHRAEQYKSPGRSRVPGIFSPSTTGDVQD
jgi:hypothetical protein